MANTLQQAIIELQQVIDSVAGIRKVPTYATEEIPVFPFVQIYPESGEIDTKIVGSKTGLHNIIIELHVARKDLPRDIQKSIGFVDSIPTALFTDLFSGASSTFSAVQTWDTISYSYGALNWGNKKTFGIRFTMSNVKVIKIL